MGNQAAENGGITTLFKDDSVELDNCILWNNAANVGADIFVNYGIVSANYSIFNPEQSNGSITGTSNLNLDPLFVDADGPDGVLGTEDDNASLLSTSYPAINHGSVSVVGYLSTDILGKHRGQNSDIGAFEYSTNSVPSFSTDSKFSITENQDIYF